MFEGGGIRELLQQHWTSVLATADASRTGAPPVVDTGGWVELVNDCQELINTLGAIQSVALAQVAAIDDHIDRESGQCGEVFRGVGHERLDAPALVADALGLTASGATQRVAAAVDLVTRHGTVVAAMGEGRLDVYRAGIVASELAEADPATCAEVTSRVAGHLGVEPGGLLRRRIRRTLASVDADLVREQAVRARAERSLRRSAHSVGVDEWSAKIPAEDSRPAWSVLDTIARAYVREGRCATLEQARQIALVDSIMGRATGQITVNLTVPVSALTSDDGGVERADEDVVPVTGFGVPGVTHVRVDWLKALVGSTSPSGHARIAVVACQDATGALATLAIPGDPEGLTGAQPRHRAQTARQRASLLAPTKGSDGAESSWGSPAGAPARGEDRYRPPPWLIEFVRARDGRCRFPGCGVSAVFCDVDHVVPWPVGSTHPSNLVCLCRRHHRIKQRPRWRSRLLTDGRLEWTDPIGRLRTTLPVDHLDTDQGTTPPDGSWPPTQQPDPAAATRPCARAATRAVEDGTPRAPTCLEEALEYLLGTRLVELACRPGHLTGRNRRALARGNRVSTRHLEPGHGHGQVVLELDPAWMGRHDRLGRVRRGLTGSDDPPPF